MDWEATWAVRGGVEMRIDEVITAYTRYRIAHPTHGRLSAIYERLNP